MKQNYLPGNTRDRLQDLMKQYKLTQAELAKRVDVAESTLSRFISGKTDKLGNESIIRIAKEFNVSTDFILGVVNEPDRKNYDIAELGLSAKAARNLYTGKVNADIASLLLENPHFAEATYLISHLLDDDLAKGFAAQNEMYDTIAEMVSGNKNVIHDVKSLKVAPYAFELSAIQKHFMASVEELKKEKGTSVDTAKEVTRNITKDMFKELTKCQDVRKCKITVKDIWRAVKKLVNEEISNTKGTEILSNKEIAYMLGGDADDVS